MSVSLDRPHSAFSFRVNHDDWCPEVLGVLHYLFGRSNKNHLGKHTQSLCTSGIPRRAVQMRYVSLIRIFLIINIHIYILLLTYMRLKSSTYALFATVSATIPWRSAALASYTLYIMRRKVNDSVLLYFVCFQVSTSMCVYMCYCIRLCKPTWIC